MAGFHIDLTVCSIKAIATQIFNGKENSTAPTIKKDKFVIDQEMNNLDSTENLKAIMKGTAEN